MKCTVQSNVAVGFGIGSESVPESISVNVNELKDRLINVTVWLL